MKKVGGQLKAVSVDPPGKNREVMEKARLAFPILADESRAATKAFGVLHEKGSPDGNDIPLPSMFLINHAGIIAWERIATAVQDRPDPRDVIAAIRASIN